MNPKEKQLIDLLNKAISLCEPMSYAEFNKLFIAKNKEEFLAIEDADNKLGVTDSGMSTLSIIATITDILTDKRLAFNINTDSGLIEGVCFWDYENNKKFE